ncbi:MAG TPA: 2-phosphosulfolactate phosphatase [Pirellulales bacterium]|nr:2-phosphosulfolactate phosphatase [Pirellulales bacterium]
MKSLRVHFLPSLTSADELAGGAVVVIDVLRATTTIIHAVAAGAREVIPCLEIEDARRMAAGFPPGAALLGGERGGVKIDGFDLGNSPEEYNRATVGGKVVVLTTTNGTRAMMLCRQAKRVLVGAFVNASAVARALAQEEQVHLLCAGTEGKITREDVLFAGRVAYRLLGELAGSKPEQNDPCRLARESYQNLLSADGIDLSAGPDSRFEEIAALTQELRHSHGGRNLIDVGLEYDIGVAAQVDRFTIVPELSLESWSIGAIV